MKPPRAVLVVGMHRTGTSLLAKILSRAGIHMGENLMPADTHNADGYFESVDIVAIHDRVLAALDRRWGSVRSTLPLPDDWRSRREVLQARSDLAAIVERYLQRGDPIWGFKDPRTCRLLPLWLDILSDHGVSPVILLTSRAPAEAAQSLEKRDGLPLRIGELLWLEHVLEALVAGRRYIAMVVDWDRWFDDPEGQASALAAVLDLPAQTLLDAAADSINPVLRHQRSSPAAVIPLAAEVHQALTAWSRDNVPPSALPRLIGRFHDAVSTLSGWADVAQASDWMADLHRRDAEINALRSELGTAKSGLAEYRHAYERDVSAYRTAYDKAIAAYRAVEAQSLGWAKELQKAREGLAEYRAAYDRDVSAYRTSYDGAMSAYRALEAQVSTCTVELQRARDGLAECQNAYDRDVSAYRDAYDRDVSAYRDAYDRDVSAYRDAYDRDVPAYRDAYDRDVSAYRSGFENAMTAYRALEIQASSGAEELGRLTTELRGILKDLLGTAGMSRVKLLPAGSPFDVLTQLRTVVLSARWAAAWPARRLRMGQPAASGRGR